MFTYLDAVGVLKKWFQTTKVYGLITESKICPYFLWISQELENSVSLGQLKLGQEKKKSEKIGHQSSVCS